jgi:ssDNA-binding Zn-finger/Zn-ribbon topoisomerase 1
MVAETDYPAAVVLLREAEENYLKDIACPKCHTNHLEIKETRNNPAGFWGKLKNQIAFGQTSTYKKEYVCTNCGAVHAEIPASF